MSNGFQSQVYSQPAAGVAGNRASQNPLFSYDAGPGGLVSGPSLFVGRFAWVTPPLDPNGTPTEANSYGAGAPSGFLMNEMQGLNTTFLSAAGMQVQPGAAIDLQISGDFWVVNDGSTEAQYGMKAYANLTTGKVSFAATGSPTTGPSAAASTIAATTFSVEASIAGNLMTVASVNSGTVRLGSTISGSGVASGTKVLEQVSGTAGGAGVYAVSIADQTVAQETISGTYGLMALGTVTNGPFAVGQQLNATGAVVAGTTITELISGSGGTGSTFAVDNNTVVSSQAITALTTVETKFYCRSAGSAGQVVKISSTSNAGGSN